MRPHGNFPAPPWRDQLIRAIADRDQKTADRLLDEIDRRHTLEGRGYNMSLLRGAMHGSRGGLDEFDSDCIYQLACMYDHPAPGHAGSFTYESPSYYLDAPNPQTIAPLATGTAQRIQFNAFGAGMVIGILGSVLDAATGLAVDPSAASFRLQINGKDNLNTNGQTVTFTNYGNILRTTAPYAPFRRLVSSLDFMDVVFQSNVAGGGINIIPQFTLAFGSMLRRIV